MKGKIKFIQVEKDFSSKYISGFIEVYKKSFSEAPYFEFYADDWITKNIWVPHVNNGRIILAMERDQVIGLGCCIILGQVPGDDLNIKIKNFLDSLPALPFQLDRTCYMSEIAVLKDFRCLGVGEGLIKERINWAKKNGADHYVMRTATEASNSKSLYLRLGAAEVPGAVQDVSEHAKVVRSSSTTRVYLFGKTS